MCLDDMALRLSRLVKEAGRAFGAFRMPFQGELLGLEMQCPLAHRHGAAPGASPVALLSTPEAVEEAKTAAPRCHEAAASLGLEPLGDRELRVDRLNSPYRGHMIMIYHDLNRDPLRKPCISMPQPWICRGLEGQYELEELIEEAWATVTE